MKKFDFLFPLDSVVGHVYAWVFAQGRMEWHWGGGGRVSWISEREYVSEPAVLPRTPLVIPYGIFFGPGGAIDIVLLFLYLPWGKSGAFQCLYYFHPIL